MKISRQEKKWVKETFGDQAYLILRFMKYGKRGFIYLPSAEGFPINKEIARRLRPAEYKG